MGIEKIANAIEADAGETLPDLRQALSEAKTRTGRAISPAQIAVRQPREATHLRQQAFADRIGTPVATLRD